MSTTAAPRPWPGDPASTGTSLTHPISDVPARRHLMPSVMDDPISPERQCVCPGGDVENNCIDVWTSADDRLCDACRQNCWERDENGVIRPLSDIYGTIVPALPSEVVWTPNDKLTRAHAFLKECRGCHGSLAEHMAKQLPGSLCRQAWSRSWNLAEADPTLKRCGTCARLVATRTTVESR